MRCQGTRIGAVKQIKEITTDKNKSEKLGKDGHKNLQKGVIVVCVTFFFFSLIPPHFSVSLGEISELPIHGITVFWRRPVLLLKIDPSQLSSGNEVRPLSSFPLGNRSNVVS